MAVAELSAPGLRPPAPRRSGRFETACGELSVSVTGRPPAPMRVRGSIEALDAGAPLRLSDCGPRSRLFLDAGDSWLSVPSSGVMRADHLSLDSPAPRPPAPPPPAGRVIAVAEGGPPGAPGKARLAVTSPSWLVLGQSYNPGWRAWCRDGSGDERSLGAPLAIDGYANGWQVQPGCTTARFAFAPQRTAVIAYAISALVSLVLLGIVVAGTLRRRGRKVPAARSLFPAPPSDPLLRPGWTTTLAVSAGMALLAAGLFALRMGVVVGALTFLLLRVGVSARRLIGLAALLTAVLPVLYLVFPAEDKGGYSFEYANDQVNAHWLTVVIVCCLGAGGLLAAWRMRPRPGAGQAEAGTPEGTVERPRQGDLLRR